MKLRPLLGQPYWQIRYREPDLKELGPNESC